MIVVKIGKTGDKLLTPFKDMHMWNSDFKIENSHVKGELHSLQDHYVDTLQNFVSLPYVPDINNDGKPTVKTVYTGANVVEQYQIAKLLGKMLYNDTFSRVATESDYKLKVIHQYEQFESYFTMVNGQPSKIRDIFNDLKNITDVRQNDKQKLKLIDGVKVVNLENITFENRQIPYVVEKRIKTILLIFMIKFHYIAPNIGCKYYNNLLSRYSATIQLIKEALDPKVTLKRLIEVYVKFLDDIVKTVCYEGLTNVGMEYHFTELAKEFYVLKHHGKSINDVPTIPIANIDDPIGTDTFIKIRNQIKDNSFLPNTQQLIWTKNDGRVNTFLWNTADDQGLLAQMFSYFKSNNDESELRLTKLVGVPNAYTEEIPRAIEYNLKILLVKQHDTRISSILFPFENMINLLCTIDIGKLSEFVNLVEYTNSVKDISTNAKTELISKRAKQIVGFLKLYYLFSKIPSIQGLYEMLQNIPLVERTELVVYSQEFQLIFESLIPDNYPDHIYFSDIISEKLSNKRDAAELFLQISTAFGANRLLAEFMDIEFELV
jgi:hypothetical protein